MPYMYALCVCLICMPYMWQVLVHQFDVLETMSPQGFGDFRDFLSSASGYLYVFLICIPYMLLICIPYMYPLYVFLICIPYMYPLYVYALYVYALYVCAFVSGSNQSDCALYVFLICTPYMCTPVCLVPINAVLPYMCPLCVRLICVHACIRFQSKRFCLICVPYVYALYVCLICVPYVYTRVSGSNQSSSASLKTSWASTRTSASCTLAVRTSSIFLTPRYLREHILWQENTFYGKRTHSIV